jgi:type I restriction enzyme R subunit
MDRVVADIIFDFSVKPRLSNQRGNAFLVASSIYEACKYFDLFQRVRPQFKAAAKEGMPKRFIFCQNCVHL